MRKSELGNVVAASMADIMDSEEHRQLFSTAMQKTDQDEADDKKDSCMCMDADDDCPCQKGGECKCAKQANFRRLFEGVLKLSEELDEMGMSKTAAVLIKVADGLLIEAAGDSLEEVIEDNPDLDVEMAVLKEDNDDLPLGGSVGPEESEEDEEAMAIELDRLLKEIEESEAEGKSDSDIVKELDLGAGEPPDVLDEELSEIEAASKEVDKWLKKNGSAKEDQLDEEYDIANLIATAEQEVDDYLINQSFEDE